MNISLANKQKIRFRLGMTLLLTTLCHVVPLQAVAGADLYTYVTRYNLDGQVTGKIKPDPENNHVAERYIYSDKGALVEVQYGILSDDIRSDSWNNFSVSRSVLYERNTQGWKTAERVRMGNTIVSLVEYEHDAYGRVICEAVRMNPSTFAGGSEGACLLGSQGNFGPDRVTTYEYDKDDNILEIRKAVGTPLEVAYAIYTYDGNGNRVSVTDANNYKAVLEYDSFDRLQYWYFPDRSVEDKENRGDYEYYEYDNNGNIIRLRKRDESVIKYTYDGLNRLTKKVAPESTVFYRYDLLNRQLHARFGSHSGQGSSYEYNGFGDVLKETINVGGNARTLEHRYDQHGNRTVLIHPDGQRFDYSYDNLDRLVSVSEHGGVVLAQHNYDSLGRLDEITLSSGVSTSYDYDAASRLKTLAFDFVADQYDLDLDYSYNPASQLVHQRLSHHQYQHTDAIGRQGEYQSDGLNQYTHIDGVAVKYDNNGNLTKLANQSFQYDSENRLTSAAVGNTATLDYDPKGRLHRLTIDGDATTFLYDGDSLVAEYHGNTLAKRYVHSTTFDTPLAGYTGSNISNASREYYHRNHQGSIIAISDQNGSVDTINTYDAYGNPGAGNEGRFGYTGQVALHELGLYHYRARVYSPGLGRFLQTDPIGYADQMNLYSYVGNDPLNFTDPTGLAKCGSLEGSDCETALDSAQAARDKANQIGEALEELSGKISASGLESLSDHEMSIVDAVGQHFGDAFQGASGLSELSGRFHSLAGRIGPRGGGVLLNRGNDRSVGIHGVPRAYVGGSNYTIYVNRPFLEDRNSVARSRTMLHETVHLVYPGLHDFYRANGIRAGLAQGASMKSNPDSYACMGFGGCGF